MARLCPPATGPHPRLRCCPRPCLPRISQRPSQPVIRTRAAPRLRFVQLPVVPAVIAPVLRDPRVDRQYGPMRASAAVTAPHTLLLPVGPHAVDGATREPYPWRGRAGRTGAHVQQHVPTPVNSPNSSPGPPTPSARIRADRAGRPVASQQTVCMPRRQFRTHHGTPVNAETGEAINWLQPPVLDRGWNATAAGIPTASA
jgi:hypothetical protein